MKLMDALHRIQVILFPYQGEPVCKTCAEFLAAKIPSIVLESRKQFRLENQGGRLLIVIGDGFGQPLHTLNKDNVYFQIDETGSGLLWSSKAHHLYAWLMDLVQNHGEDDLSPWKNGVLRQRSFRWHRSTYDHFLNQGGRLIRNFNRELYFSELARLGFTHVEVNGLAFSMALETGPVGETYPMFYTYCPALDQFVYSELNKGIYPYYYLSANLSRLQENVQWARKYGLTPGLLCFEPRSVPEQLFERYPMLRGARVDHPFRSFKPRYNLSIVHPRVRAHYAEMLQKLLHKAPQLAYMDIWTNDSGAGFEHTKSLYVGRNGGAFLIREWKDDAEIARQAGENALRFMRTLRDAAAAVNPDFRVITRMESFYGEHETVWQGLGDRIDVETNSLFAMGYQLQYSHPRYPEIKEVSGGSIYQSYVDDREMPLLQQLAQRNSLAHFNFSCGSFAIFEPLLGIPYPRLTFQKIKAMYDAGLDCLAHQGGAQPANLAPYSVNHEILSAFAADAKMDFEKVLKRIARRWAGEENLNTLLAAWQLAEEAILAFPVTNGLYSTFGFTWFRLWQRPFTPNLETIPDQERRYYEDHICTTPHNPNNVDLAQDVLFTLVTPQRCEEDMQRMDDHLWLPLDKAIRLLAEKLDSQYAEIEPSNVLYDQWIRLRALKCWFRTQYSVNAWVAGVHGYLRANQDSEKKRYRAMIREMMIQEIENSQELFELWQTAKIEFMAIADQGETPLIHGRCFGENLLKRIELMQAHLEDEPYINGDYINVKSLQEFGQFNNPITKGTIPGDELKLL